MLKYVFQIYSQPSLKRFPYSILVIAYVYRISMGGVIMTASRQDAWTKEEDTNLEVVLRHIRAR
jgi:hypothetical protein